MTIELVRKPASISGANGGELTRDNFLSATGAWTIGPIAANNFSAQRHTINGTLFSGNLSDSANSGFFVIGNNARVGGSTAQDGRTNQLTGGTAICLSNGTSTSSAALEIVTNTPGQAPGLNGAVVGSVTNAGAWTLGPVAGVLGSVARITNTQLLLGLDDFDTNGNFLQIGRRSAATKSAYIVAGIGVECGMEFLARNVSATAVTVGSYSSLGLWTMGRASGFVNDTHTIYGNFAFAAGGGDKGLGLNTFFDASRSYLRTSTTTGGSAITFNPNTLTTGTALSLYVNAPGDGTTTPAIAALVVYNDRIVQTNANVGAGSPGLIVSKTSGNVASSEYITFRHTATSAASLGTLHGGIRSNSGNTAFEFFFNSDQRKKQNVAAITDGLDKISALRPVTFRWKPEHGEGGGRGFIAQEVLSAVPEAVKQEADGYYTMGTSEFVPLLVAAIKELKAEFDAYVATHP